MGPIDWTGAPQALDAQLQITTGIDGGFVAFAIGLGVCLVLAGAAITLVLRHRDRDDRLADRTR